MIALLLHMHQPDYRDPKDGRPTMPWVRLHATRGYRDVPLLAKKLGATLTLNLVPSLLDQWDFYAAGGTDIHQELAQRPADSLRPHEISWMLESFFHGHPSSFRWFPAWGRLRARRDAGEHFDRQALQDLQVWTNLAWFGFTALQDWPELGELRRKGVGFSEAEKLRVLQIQSQILRDLKGLYRGGPEISASPYFHPILPLLVDNAHAQRCMPGNPDPGFRFPEDARLQLRAA
ncbi:MAG TPA: glycoside hydrolase, partial [Myxococcota bacterium]|nr:glycoside hydrolase [Myxococcota bacterium]